MRTFGSKSLALLQLCHPVMNMLCHKALELGPNDFSINESYRNRDDQEAAFRQGNTKVHYPESAHNQKPSVAIDFLPYPFNGWHDDKGFHAVIAQFFSAARALKIEIRSGSDFNRDGNLTTTDAWDLPHIELHPWREWRDGKHG